MDDTNVGFHLHAQGWQQGSFITAESASVAWLERSASEEPWRLQYIPLLPTDRLVVASQTCDIIKAPDNEPYVEFVVCQWTSDGARIHDAGKRSVRFFVLERRRDESGQEVCLVADAALWVRVQKQALVGVAPEGCCPELPAGTARTWRKWLARRYDREPLADDLVKAVQRPIVTEYEKLRGKPLRRVIDRFMEIRFLPVSDSPPYLVGIVLLYDPDQFAEPASPLEVLELRGWFADALAKAGHARISTCEPVSIERFSVYDYVRFHEMPLEHVTLAGDDAAGPVPHGGPA